MTCSVYGMTVFTLFFSFQMLYSMGPFPRLHLAARAVRANTLRAVLQVALHALSASMLP
jgi:hypothetical protein